MARDEVYGAGRGYGPGEGSLTDYVEGSNSAVATDYAVEAEYAPLMIEVDGVMLPSSIAKALLEQQAKIVG